METRALLDRFREPPAARSGCTAAAPRPRPSSTPSASTSATSPTAPNSTQEKIGHFLPGTGIEIRPEDEAIDARPDYYLVTAWNYRNELIQKVRAGGNAHSGFAVPFPEVQIIVTSAADIYEQTAAAAGRSEAAE